MRVYKTFSPIHCSFTSLRTSSSPAPQCLSSPKFPTIICKMSASQFGDLKKETGLTSLNSFLADKSYIEGYTPSQADVAVFSALLSAPGSAFMHCLRWYNHIKSYTPEEQKSFPAAEQKQAKAAAAADDDDDDDFDLFGDNDDEEETEEQKRIKEERVAAYNVKKSKKTAIIAKSSLLIDVKPWDDETDMAEMERCVRTVEIDGLIWGKSQLVPLAFGIKKLQIGAVIEDDKVSTDILEEEITKFDDHVQSMDIAAFNKI